MLTMISVFLAGAMCFAFIGLILFAISGMGGPTPSMWSVDFSGPVQVGPFFYRSAVSFGKAGVAPVIFQAIITTPEALTFLFIEDYDDITLFIVIDKDGCYDGLDGFTEDRLNATGSRFAELLHDAGCKGLIPGAKKPNKKKLAPWVALRSRTIEQAREEQTASV